MNLIAHRGFAGEHPENTVRAVSAAAARAAMVEIDVRRCGSGEAVVIHDATVDRVTDGHGPVRGHSLAELRDLNVLGSGEGVPALDELLAAVPADTGVNVELKESVIDEVVTAARSVDNDVLCSSFDPAILSDLRERDPDLPRALLCGGSDGHGDGVTDDRTDPVDWISRARELDCAAIHPAVDLALSGTFVASAHEADLAVNAWTVRDASTAGDLDAAGIDGVIADFSDVI